MNAVAERLSKELGDSDILVRMGSDEFAVIQTSEISPIRWEGAAQRLRMALERPFAFHGQAIHIAAQIGVARYPADGSEVDQLLTAADLALQAAKENKLGFSAFDTAFLVELENRKQLEESLRLAIEQDDLTLFMQPKTDLITGRWVGAEALVRWNHPSLGRIGPSTFIPIAEETGLVLPLGRWVLERACREALTWDGAIANAVVAVNVSPSQFFYEDIVTEVEAALAATGLPPHRLELEITEGVLMRNHDTAISTLEGLSKLGVLVSLDDFGTGYSSLGYLKHFRLNKLKIDRSFVKDITRDKDDQLIVRAMVELADGLGLTTIAEGIETKTQAKLLIKLGCEEGQGYLYGKPMPAGDFRSEGRLSHQTRPPQLTAKTLEPELVRHAQASGT